MCRLLALKQKTRQSCLVSCGNSIACTRCRQGVFMADLKTRHGKRMVAVIIRGNRQGSSRSRQSHSSPIVRSHLGARGTMPARKSKDPPTPIMTGTSSAALCWAMNRSCLGAPKATKSTSGFACFIRSISASLLVAPCPCRMPSSAPRILNEGNCFFSAYAAMLATFGRPPTR